MHDGEDVGIAIVFSLYRSQIETKLQQMGLSLPPPSAPVANYVPSVRTGNLIFLSGVPPQRPDGTYFTGKLGNDLTVEQGYEAARSCGLNLLTNLKGEMEDLDRVVRIVKFLGVVCSDPQFTQQPAVINGCSDILVEIFGARGKNTQQVTCHFSDKYV